MRGLDVMGEIRRALRERGIDPKTRIEPPPWRPLAIEIAKTLPYGVATVERVLELAVELGLDDPEEFLRRCSSVALDPIAVLWDLRRCRPVEQRFDGRSPFVQAFGLRRSRLWLYGARLWLVVALVAFFGAIRAGSGFDVGLTFVLVLGASLAIHVESRRLP